MARAAARLVIEGRVQGVGYRWWAVETAQRLGVRGWVRNRADGSVEALAIGESSQIELFVAACRQGPAHASVRSVAAAGDVDDGSPGFTQKPTL